MSHPVPPRFQWYFDHPGAWESTKQTILEHDKTCLSLPDIWLGRSGGVTSPGDIGTCDDCKVTFYNEGLMGQYPPEWTMGDPVLQTQKYLDEGDEDEYEASLCDCCGRKRLAAEQ